MQPTRKYGLPSSHLSKRSTMQLKYFIAEHYNACVRICWDRGECHLKLCYEDVEEKRLAEYFSPFVFLLVWIYNEFPASPTTDPGTPEQVNSSEWNS